MLRDRQLQWYLRVIITESDSVKTDFPLVNKCEVMFLSLIVKSTHSISLKLPGYNIVQVKVKFK